MTPVTVLCSLLLKYLHLSWCLWFLKCKFDQYLLYRLQDYCMQLVKICKLCVEEQFRMLHHSYFWKNNHKGLHALFWSCCTTLTICHSLCKTSPTLPRLCWSYEDDKTISFCHLFFCCSLQNLVWPEFKKKRNSNLSRWNFCFCDYPPNDTP